MRHGETRRNVFFPTAECGDRTASAARELTGKGVGRVFVGNRENPSRPFRLTSTQSALVGANEDPYA